MSYLNYYNICGQVFPVNLSEYICSISKEKCTNDHELHTNKHYNFFRQVLVGLWRKRVAAEVPHMRFPNPVYRKTTDEEMDGGGYIIGHDDLLFKPTTVQYSEGPDIPEGDAVSALHKLKQCNCSDNNFGNTCYFEYKNIAKIIFFSYPLQDDTPLAPKK